MTDALRKSNHRKDDGQEGVPRVIGGARFAPPRVIIEYKALQKLYAYVDLCPVEINGFGIVERSDGNKFLITDIFILDQVVSETKAVTDDAAYNRLVYALVSQGRSADALKLQWHSHVMMPVFFSPEDLGTIAGYTTDFMISLVSNKRREYACRIDIFKPFHVSLETELLVRMPPVERGVVEECAEEIRAKVKRNHFLFPGKKRVNPRAEDLEPLVVPLAFVADVREEE